MPPFMTLPPQVQPRRGITAGLPAYSAGAFAYGQSPTKFYVTSVTASGATVTLGVKLVEGNIPLVGALITVMGTVVGGPLVNVTNVALSAVSITASTGLGTVQYASTAPLLAQTNDGGMAIVAVPEIGDTLAVQKYQQFCLDPTAGYGLSWTVSFPSAPATNSIQLEGAINDVDAEYAVIGAAVTAVVTTTTIATTPEGVRFVRLNNTATTGGVSPTVVGKIFQSVTK